MTTSREKFFYTRTLCCLLKALEGVETEIELRNDSSVIGTVEFVSSAMSVTMRNCVLIVNERPKRLQRMSIQGRKIRMVLIPDDISILDAMQGVIAMYNAPVLGKFEYRRGGRCRGRGGVTRGRGRSRGPGQGTYNIQGDRRGQAPAGRGAGDWGRGQAFGRGFSLGTQSRRALAQEENVSDTVESSGDSSVHPHSRTETIRIASVPSDLRSHQNISLRLLAEAMGGSQLLGVETGDDSSHIKSHHEVKQPRTGGFESDTRKKSHAGKGRDSSPEFHRRSKSGRREKHTSTKTEKSERRSHHSDSSKGGRSSTRKERRHRSQSSQNKRSPERHGSDGQVRSRNPRESADAGGLEDLRMKLLRKKGMSDTHDSGKIAREHRHQDYRQLRNTGSDSERDRYRDRYDQSSRSFCTESSKLRSLIKSKIDSSPEHTARKSLSDGDYSRTHSRDKEHRSKPASTESPNRTDSEHKSRHRQSSDSERERKSSRRHQNEDRQFGSSHPRVSSDYSSKTFSRRDPEGSPRDDSTSRKRRSPEYYRSPDGDHQSGSDSGKHESDNKETEKSK